MASEKLHGTTYLYVASHDSDPDTASNALMQKIRMVSAVTKRSLARAERRASVLEIEAKRESDRPPTGEFVIPDSE